MDVELIAVDPDGTAIVYREDGTLWYAALESNFEAHLIAQKDVAHIASHSPKQLRLPDFFPNTESLFHAAARFFADFNSATCNERPPDAALALALNAVRHRCG